MLKPSPAERVTKTLVILLNLQQKLVEKQASKSFAIIHFASDDAGSGTEIQVCKLSFPIQKHLFVD